MDDEHEVVDVRFEEVVRRLRPSILLDILRARRLITREEYCELQSKTSEKSRSQKLLEDFLLSKPLGSFHSFCEVISDPGQSHSVSRMNGQQACSREPGGVARYPTAGTKKPRLDPNGESTTSKFPDRLEKPLEVQRGTFSDSAREQHVIASMRMGIGMVAPSEVKEVGPIDQVTVRSTEPVILSDSQKPFCQQALDGDNAADLQEGSVAMGLTSLGESTSGFVDQYSTRLAQVAECIVKSISHDALNNIDTQSSARVTFVSKTEDQRKLKSKKRLIKTTCQECFALPKELVDFLGSDNLDVSSTSETLGYPCYVDIDSKLAVLDIDGVNITTFQSNSKSLEQCIFTFLQTFDPEVSLHRTESETLEVSPNCSSIVMRLDIIVFLCLLCALGDKEGRDNLRNSLQQKFPGSAKAMFRLGGLPPIHLSGNPTQTRCSLEESELFMTPVDKCEGNHRQAVREQINSADVIGGKHLSISGKDTNSDVAGVSSTKSGVSRVHIAKLLEQRQCQQSSCPLPLPPAPNAQRCLLYNTLSVVAERFQSLNNLMSVVQSLPNPSTSSTQGVRHEYKPTPFDSDSQVETGQQQERVFSGKSTHVSREGAAGSLLAVNLLNAPLSVVQEVLSVAKELTVTSGLSDTSSTYSESGPSGKVAVSFKYDGNKTPQFHSPSRNRSFTGRVDMLKKLHTLLSHVEVLSVEELKSSRQGNRLDSSCTFAALSGLGGTGKTSVAVEYAWLFQRYYKGGCCWLSGDDLEGSIRNISVDVDVTVRRQALSFHDQLRELTKYLCRLSGLWLMVVDNMDLTELTPLLETILLGPWRQGASHGALLVTSRCKPDVLVELLHLDTDECIIPVLEFEEQESVQFLERRMNHVKDAVDYSVENAKLLAKKLGHLPLALEQAVAHIVVIRCPLTDYIREYKKQHTKLLKKKGRQTVTATGDGERSKHRLAVHTTWQINFDRIRSDEEFGQYADTFVQMAAFLGPDNLRFALLRAVNSRLSSSRMALLSVVHLLTELSLFRAESKESLNVHRLVQEVLQETLRGDLVKLYATLQSAVSILASALKGCALPDISEKSDSVIPASHKLWGDCASHALELQRNIFSCADSLGQRFYGLFCSDLAFLLKEASVYASGIGRQSTAKQLDSLKLRVLDVMEKPCSGGELSQMTAMLIPLPVSSQLNVRRAIGDKTLLIAEKPENALFQCVSGVQSLEDVDMPTLTETQKVLGALDSDILHNVIHCWSNELSDSSNMTASKRFVLLCRRAKAHVVVGNIAAAVADAEECIRLQPGRSEGYNTLAQVFAVTKCHCTPMARCVAAVTRYLDPSCLMQTWFQQHYSHVDAAMKVTSHLDLRKVLRNQKRYRNCTILLGRFEFQESVPPLTEGLNLVGLQSFSLHMREHLSLSSGKYCFINVQVRRAGIICQLLSSVCFSHCRFTNSILVYGSAWLKRCQIVNSPTDGLIASGSTARVALLSCLVSGNKCAGLRAENGASLLVFNSTVCENRDGLQLGHIPGYCLIHSSRIFMNQEVGIRVSHVVPGLNPVHGEEWVTSCVAKMPYQSKDLPSLVIDRNEICENGTYGVSLLGMTPQLGVVAIRKNLISSNGFWGFSSVFGMEAATYAVVNDNMIRGNKCGGVRLRTMHNQGHILTNNVVDKNNVAFNAREILPDLLVTLKQRNKVKDMSRTFQYPMIPTERQSQCCSFCRSLLKQRGSRAVYCTSCYTSVYCKEDCLDKHSVRHKKLCKIVRERFSATAPTTPGPFYRERGYVHQARATVALDPQHRRGPLDAQPPKADGCRFIVKLQTIEEKTTASECLEVYDRSLAVSTYTNNWDLCQLVVNCGVLGVLQGTSKKIFCWAKLEDTATIRIFYHELAPYTDEW